MQKHRNPIKLILLIFFFTFLSCSEKAPKVKEKCYVTLILHDKDVVLDRVILDYNFGWYKDCTTKDKMYWIKTGNPEKIYRSTRCIMSCEGEFIAE